MTHAFDQFRAIIIIAITAALFISSSCQQEHQQPQKTQAPSSIANAEQGARTEDGYRLMAMKDYANKRFSALDQNNAQNVNHLKVEVVDIFQNETAMLQENHAKTSKTLGSAKVEPGLESKFAEARRFAESAATEIGLLMTVFIVSAFYLRPDWGQVASSFIPHVPRVESRQEYYSYAYFAIALLSSIMLPYESYFYASRSWDRP